MKAKLLAMLKYISQFYKAEIDLELEVQAWLFVFEDEDYMTIRTAVKKWMQTEKKMPTPQDIYRIINSTYSNVKEWMPTYDLLKLWDEERVDEEGGLPFEEFCEKYLRTPSYKKKD